jgi:hypothetical protein
MYAIFFRVFSRLLTSPGKEWNSLAEERHFDSDHFFRNFLHPSVGLIALCAFVGGLLRAGSFDVVAALQAVVCEAVAAFGGVFLAALAIRLTAKQLLATDLRRGWCEKFAGYASTAVFLSSMAGALLTSWPAVRLIGLVSVVTVQTGVGRYLDVSQPRKPLFTAAAWLSIAIAPALIRTLLYQIILLR